MAAIFIRDGLENAANGIIAGWFYARACSNLAQEAVKRLHVIRQEDARKVVDVEVIEMPPFANLTEFENRMNAVVDLRLPKPVSVDIIRYGKARYAMVKVPVFEDCISWIGKCAVTNGEYKVFCEETGHPKPEYLEKLCATEENQPVVMISYVDAEKFCEWAGLKLPTEEQWKHFARAGSQDRYWWGSDDSLLPQVAWFKDNSNNNLQSVGRKAPNTWNIHDIYGNTWEWTRKYKTAVTSRYSEVETTAYRARICGGAYTSDPMDLHTSEERLLNDKSFDIGFRCIKTKNHADE